MAVLERARRGLRRRGRKALIGGFLTGFAGAARLHPRAKPSRHHVEVLRDIPYRDSGLAEHRLDVYRPTRGSGPRPVVLYLHGGGFTQLSKDTHWVMGLAYARVGFLVLVASYRLAPRHPYPAALEDACAAYRWAVERGAELGGDPARITVAGESAGANLVCGVTVASCYRRPERFAREVFDLDAVPSAALPACGLLQVSDTARFTRRRSLPPVVRMVMSDINSAYLGAADRARPGGLELADPLLIFERGGQPDRGLPPFFAGVGTRDPLLDDTRRLGAALEKLGATCETAYYPGEIHAFHALVWRKRARQLWADTYRFLDRHVGPR